MTALVLVASVLVLLAGVAGYVATGNVWLLVLAGIGLVASASGWVLSHGGSRHR